MSYRFCRWMLVTLAAAVSVSVAASQDVRETVLANGMKVLTKEIHAAPVVSIWTYYRVGSRNELPGITGISHQIEHMMFKGTPNLKPGEIDRLTALAGGKNNAFTDTDYTAYYFAFPSDAAAPPGHSGLDTALRIEADRMSNCTFDPQELAHEKQVVLSELEGDENSPFNRLDENVKAAAFMAHPYHYPTIGWRTDVEAFTRDAVRDYYRTYYKPNNAVLVIVGDFETERVLRRVRELFEPIPRRPDTPKIITAEPPQTGERTVTVKGESSALYFMALYRIPETTHADMYPLSVLDSVLTMGKSSRLHHALVESGLAVEVTSELSQKIDPGWETFYVTCPSTVDRDKFERAFDSTIADLRHNLLSASELAKGKRLSSTQMIFAMDSVSDQGSLLGSYDVSAGWRYLSNLVPNTERVTAEQVRAAAKKYLAADNRTVGWFVPTKITNEKPVPTGKPGPIRRKLARIQPSNALASAVTSRSGLGPSGMRSSILTSHAPRVVLPNGLTLILQPEHANPTVAVSGFVDAGAVFDPQGKPGVANLVAEMLDRGTATKPVAVYQRELDSLGAELDFTANMDAMTFDGKCLSQDLPKLLTLVHDALRKPAFDSRQLTRVKANQIASLQEESDSPYLSAINDVKDAIYPKGHPERHQVRGSEESVKSISRSDLLTFYKRHYRPDTTTIVLVGDFDPQRVRQQLESLFSDWHANGERPPLELPELSTPDKLVTQSPLRLPLNDKAEAIVVMGARGVNVHSPDYFPALVANHILGGGELLNSRLLTSLREKRGLTYSVSSSFRASRGNRLWLLSMQNNPKNVDDAVTGARAEIEKMRTQPPTEDELEQARATLLGDLLLGLETSSGIAQTTRDVELYSLGPDWVAKAVDRIRAVTREDVLAAAKKYLPAPDQIVTVIAGPAK